MRGANVFGLQALSSWSVRCVIVTVFYYSERSHASATGFVIGCDAVAN